MQGREATSENSDLASQPRGLHLYQRACKKSRREITCEDACRHETRTHRPRCELLLPYPSSPTASPLLSRPLRDNLTVLPHHEGTEATLNSVKTSKTDLT